MNNKQNGKLLRQTKMYSISVKRTKELVVNAHT